MLVANKRSSTLPCTCFHTGVGLMLFHYKRTFRWLWLLCRLQWVDRSVCLWLIRSPRFLNVHNSRRRGRWFALLDIVAPNLLRDPTMIRRPTTFCYLVYQWSLSFFIIVVRRRRMNGTHSLGDMILAAREELRYATDRKPYLAGCCCWA